MPVSGCRRPILIGLPLAAGFAAAEAAALAAGLALAEALAAGLAAALATPLAAALGLAAAEGADGEGAGLDAGAAPPPQAASDRARGTMNPNSFFMTVVSFTTALS